VLSIAKIAGNENRSYMISYGYDFHITSFLLPTYEIWKVLVSLALKKICIANFHVLRLFIPKKRVMSEKKNSSATRPCRGVLDEI
jgi:hypothetical protein